MCCGATRLSPFIHFGRCPKGGYPTLTSTKRWFFWLGLEVNPPYSVKHCWTYGRYHQDLESKPLPPGVLGSCCLRFRGGACVKRVLVASCWRRTRVIQCSPLSGTFAKMMRFFDSLIQIISHLLGTKGAIGLRVTNFWFCRFPSILE